jgi:catechol 2,3-dioxygenase-like lactoylglutathione lyase family enzyme
MKIKLTSVFVDDQDKALEFYTEVLGFVKKADFPAGSARWLTVVSPELPDDIELLLEPDDNPAIDSPARKFKKALFKAGLPYAAFAVEDIQEEYERLKKLGVEFFSEPTIYPENPAGPVTAAVFDDTCGNLIMLYQA